MEELLDKYIDEILNSCDFIRLKELKKIIDTKYSKEIVSFKTCESKYNEALSYGEYYPNLDEIKKKLSESKANLYNKPEVKEYIELERKIDNLLNEDLNKLKESISNKFKLERII